MMADMSPQQPRVGGAPAASGAGSAVGGAASGDLAQLTVAELAERELARLVDGVAAFDDEARPYVSWAAPQFMGNFGGNYDHLARVWEWHVVGGEDEAPE